MIKKYSKLLLIMFIAIFASISNCFAKELTLEEVSEEVLKVDSGASYYYNIGQYIFTSNHTLTLEDTMLAAKTIVVSTNSGGTASEDIYGEMATYQFDAKYNDWFEIDGYTYTNNFTGTTVPGDTLDVCYINYTNICGDEEINKPTNSVGTPKELTSTELYEEVLKIDGNASYFYLIGQYAFTSNHTLTIEDLMLSARTISVTNGDGYTNNDAIYGLMATYQFDANYNDWFEIDGYTYNSNFTGAGTPASEHKICYINYEKICDDSILVDVDALVNDAYETIKGQAATDKFDVAINENTIDVTINDLTMSSAEALTGTGVATALANFLKTEGIDSVVLTHGDAELTVSKDNLDATALYNFLVAVAGENSENAADLDGKEIVANITFKEGYATANSDSFNIKFKNRDDIKVDVDALVNDAYETIKGQTATDKFEVALNGTEINVTIVDRTMSSVDALAGTGVATAIANFLETEGIESVTLTYGDASVVVSKDNLDADELYNFLVAVAGEDSNSAADLDGKVIDAKVEFELGYVTANSDAFKVKFETAITKVDVNALVNDAYETIKGQATDKFDVAINESAIDVTINDLTMSSAEALAGTGVATAIANFLETEGIESVTLTHGSVSVVVSKDNLDADELYNFLVAVAGEDSNSVLDLDGKEIAAKVTFAKWYETANIDSFNIKFKANILGYIDVDALVKDAYETIKGQAATDKFDVALNENTIDVTINDLTMSSVDALTGTGVATAIVNFLETEGIESVTLTHGDAKLVVSKDNLDADELYNFLVAVAGEDSDSAADLDGKVIDAKVTFAQGYLTLNIDSFKVEFTNRADIEVDVDALVNDAYETIKGQAATDKFEVALNENTIDVTINDLTMSSTEALTGTGVATALANFLKTEGIDSVVLTHGDAELTVSKDNLDATALYNFLVAVAGEDSNSAADLDGKEIVANITFKEGYVTANSDSFNIKFENRDDINVDVDALVKDAYETIKGQAATDKFEVALNGTEINVTIVDRTMSSVDALAGTGVATAIANFLETEGIESVTLTYGDASVVVSKDNLDATALYNFLVAVAGEDSNSAADLDGKVIDAKVEFELGYVTANSDAFKVKFETAITKVDVNALVNDAYETIKGQATDKFDVAINESAIDVTINDLTMSSAEALAGTGVATAIANFLETEGIDSVVLTHEDAELTVSKDNLDANELYNFLVAVAGEDSNSVLDLDGKEIAAKVTFAKWYETANIDSFNIKFKANILGYIDVNALVKDAYETIKGQAATDKFDVAINSNQVTVMLVDTTMNSAEALAGTGVATAIVNFLETEGIESVTLTHGDAKLVVSKDNLDADELYNFLVAVAGEDSDSAADLVGKTIKASVEFEQGYLTKNSKEFELTFKEIERYTVAFDSKGGNTVESETVIIGANATKPATPSKVGYTFKYWTLNGEEYDFSTPVVEDITLVAEWEINKYTVTWVDENGTVLDTDEVEYGTVPSYTGEEPTKAANNTYTYEFATWSPAVVAVTGDVTYKATYTPKYIDYTVTFVVDGKTVSEKTYHYGDTVEVPADPEKAATPQYTYTFKDWGKDVVPVAGNATYTAVFEETVNKYTVTWVDENGTVLDTDEVEYGTVPSYTGEEPTKAANNTYTYEFATWSPAVVAVTGDVTYKATYTPTYIDYTVTFVVDGKTVSETKYHYGDTVEVPADPTKDATAQYTYTFKGWDNTVTTVTGNATYTAVFTETVREYTVTYVDVNNNNLGSQKVAYGTLVNTLKAPEQDGYEFDSFDVDGTTAITGDTTLVVTYNKVINVEETLKSELATVETNDKLELGVSSGTINALFASKNTSMLALFNPIISLLESITSNSNFEKVVVTYQGKELVLSDLDYNKLGLSNFLNREEDATKVAQFISWVAFNSGSGSDIIKVTPADLIGKTLDVEITLVDGNVSENNKTVEEYDLTFGLSTSEAVVVTYDANGGTFSDGETSKIVVGYFTGNTIEQPELSAREGYTFSGWYNGNTKFDFSTKVTADMTLVANWETEVLYEVTWVTPHKIVTETYKSGSIPSFDDFEKEYSEGGLKYTFIGWDKEITPVTENITYKAQYSYAAI